MLCCEISLIRMVDHRIGRIPQTFHYFVTVYAILSLVIAGRLPYGLPMVCFLNPDAGLNASSEYLCGLCQPRSGISDNTQLAVWILVHHRDGGCSIGPPALLNVVA